MTTKSFRFSTLGYLALEGVGALHASYTLLLNITESEGKEGEKLFLSASMLCNAARAYGSGVIKPCCTVENNIDNKKYVLDSKDKAFALMQNDILIGATQCSHKASKNIQSILKICLNTGYTSSLVPIPKKATHYISLNKFKQV
ncbi:hypothetical protein [Rosenbergiella epipactidis]|uniref:hypothetical protein n=1 Tax=Rosenbergiella epipactidis TaxID=1544694 RepID=UPI001F4D8616|nr:hypothetical protein [Rosenbergiella epipactidis]